MLPLLDLVPTDVWAEAVLQMLDARDLMNLFPESTPRMPFGSVYGLLLRSSWCARVKTMGVCVP